MGLSVRMRKEGNEDAWKFVLLTDYGRDMDAIRGQASKLIQNATQGMRQGAGPGAAVSGGRSGSHRPRGLRRVSAFPVFALKAPGSSARTSSSRPR